jgi:methionine-gamma-lyase
MTTHDSHQRTIGKRKLRPESLMMSYGYRPDLSEGSIKCPLFLTSTFVFASAEEGKAFFELAYGLRKSNPGEEVGLIYSRVNNPDLQILEERLTLWDGAEEAAVFASGMAAISTTLLHVARPGDVILFSEPVYGGTDYLLKHVLPQYGIRTIGVAAQPDPAAFAALLDDRDIGPRVALIYLETPANPTNALVDIAAVSALAQSHSRARQILVAVDNTFLGPLFQHPLEHGADLVLYSATKYLGGHSDLIAGVVLGRRDLITPLKSTRTIFGTMADPMTGWQLLRSLETLKMRMTAQMKNARRVAEWLVKQPKVERVYYLGHLAEGSPEKALFARQCLGAGGMISFDIVGGEAEAFRFLNALKLFHMAVSLGGTESLVEHPATMTHSDVDPEELQEVGVTEKMVRLSIGVEHYDDLIADLEQALAAV